MTKSVIWPVMAFIEPEAGAEFKAGLQAAANHLIKTAEDYEQMAQQVQDEWMKPKSQIHRLGINAAMQKKSEYGVAAQLLRGQAKHILDIKS